LLSGEIELLSSHKSVSVFFFFFFFFFFFLVLLHGVVLVFLVLIFVFFFFFFFFFVSLTGRGSYGCCYVENGVWIEKGRKAPSSPVTFKDVAILS
jgi:hypothetical protein